MANSTLIASKNSTTGFTAYIDESTGQAFMTDTLICSVTGIDHKSLTRIVESQRVGNFASKYSQALTGQGIQGVGNLRQASDFKTILLSWKPTKKENKERKEAILNSLIDAGITAYVYGLCGYTMKPVEQPKLPTTFAEALQLAADQAKRMELLEAEKRSLEEDNNRQAEIIDELFDYSSIIRIAKYNNCSETLFSWRTLKIASQKLNLEIKTAPCPRFGKKNLYHHQAWRLAYANYRVPETTTLVINR